MLFLRTQLTTEPFFDLRFSEGVTPSRASSSSLSSCMHMSRNVVRRARGGCALTAAATDRTNGRGCCDCLATSAHCLGKEVVDRLPMVAQQPAPMLARGVLCKESNLTCLCSARCASTRQFGCARRRLETSGEVRRSVAAAHRPQPCAEAIGNSHLCIERISCRWATNLPETNRHSAAFRFATKCAATAVRLERPLERLTNPSPPERHH
jgi:hypothetical protein